MVRPTLAALGRHSVRWGALFLSAVAGAAALALTAWVMRLLSAALARDDWLGWSTLTLILIAAFAALMLLARELVGFARLARLNRLSSEVAAARASADPERERQAALSLVRLYRGRADTAWGVRRFASTQPTCAIRRALAAGRAGDLGAARLEARRLVLISAKRVATVTALSRSC
jgi:putative membrane protein